MSTDSTYNPYTPVSSMDQTRPPGGRMPLRGFVKVVCIFFIVLGALGLLQALQSIVGMAMVLSDETQFNPMNIFPGAMLVTILIGLINFAVSVCEIAGGVMGLQQKRLGANLIRSVSGFMLFFKFAETVYGCVIGYMSIGPIKEQTMKQMPPQPANGPDMGMFIEIGMYVGIGFAVLFGLVMFFFYLFSFLSFSKQETLSQFS